MKFFGEEKQRDQPHKVDLEAFLLDKKNEKNKLYALNTP